MAKKTYDLLFKVLFIGDSSVGKTQLLFRLSDDDFNTTFISTIHIDFKIRKVELDGKKIKVQIWDFADQERYQTSTASYYRGAHGVVFVYDITNAETFESVSKWLSGPNEHVCEDDVEKMLLGNNCEMEDERQVSRERAEAFAREHGMLFHEASAKSNINVEEAFLDLIRAILNKVNSRLASTVDESKEAKDQPAERNRCTIC